MTDREDDRALASRFGEAYLPLLTATAALASFTMMVAGTSIGITVPHVMGTFGVGQDKAQLMATAFYIAMTTSQLLNIWVVAVIGQRRAFALNLLLFVGASIMGAAADEFGVVVFARVVQGIAAGLIQTQTTLAIFQVFPKERRGTAMGIYAAGLVLAIRTQFHSDALAATQSSANQASMELLAGVRRLLAEIGLAAGDYQPGVLHFLGQVVHAQASALGFRDGFLVLCIGFLVAIVPALMMRHRRPSQ